MCKAQPCGSPVMGWHLTLDGDDELRDNRENLVRTSMEHVVDSLQMERFTPIRRYLKYRLRRNSSALVADVLPLT
jgi:hypothetical protein